MHANSSSLKLVFASSVAFNCSVWRTDVLCPFAENCSVSPLEIGSLLTCYP